MSTNAASLLFGAYRREVLALLLLHPDMSLHVREIARLTGKAPGTLLRELNALAEVGILVRTRAGNQVHFQANRASPIHDELRSILKKTAGIADVLREAIEPLTSKIRAAFIYGSVARGDERAGSDIDVMIIGEVKFGEVVNALSAAQDVLRREINPSLYSASEFKKRTADGDSFLKRVLPDKKIFLIGSEDDLGQLVAHRQAEAAPRRQDRARPVARGRATRS